METGMARMAGRRERLHGGRARARPLARAFTLIELLVVLAITAIVMLIMFVPLSRSLDLTQRAEATARGQDAVRTAMRRVRRDLTSAMEVFEPRPLRLWGLSAWTFNRNRGVPSGTALPEGYLVQNGIMAMRLPRQRYYDTTNSHYVTPQDIDPAGTTGLNYDAVALATCPRHPGAPVELRPIQPLEADNRITAYFIGLKNPAIRLNGAPLYDNIVYWGRSFIPQGAPGYNTLNTYVLYRVEFDPTDPRYANWNLPSGAPNPDFFYDTTPVTVAGVTQPQYQWWKDATVSIMDAETADAVRWVETAGKFLPHPLCTFGPAPVEDAVAQPNRSVGQYDLGGNAVPAELPAAQYQLDNGHWTGVQNDGSIPIWGGLLVAPTGGPAQPGPRIEILELQRNMMGQAVQVPVFDSGSGLPALRNRLVSFDSVTGHVEFAFRRWNYGGTPPYLEHLPAAVNLGSYLLDLSADAGENVTDPNGMPSSFRTARAAYGANALIVPGSEVVQLADVDGSGNTLSAQQLRRAGFTGLGAADMPVAQNDLATNEYAIDYRTGEILLSVTSDGLATWGRVSPGAGAGLKLLVRYRFQTNQATDAVRVSYVTKELAAISLGIVEYTRRKQEFLPFEISERVVIRNLRR